MNKIMSWTIMEKKRKESEKGTSEFMEALMMVKEGTEILCELAEEMEELYGERMSMRSGSMGRRYGRRDDEESQDYSERRGYSMRYK
jgi:hypothetical protein